MHRWPAFSAIAVRIQVRGIGVMIRGLSRNSTARKEWWQRVDRVAGDLNVLLVVIALGLAALDVTFLFTQRIVGHRPPVTQQFDRHGVSAYNSKRISNDHSYK